MREQIESTKMLNEKETVYVKSPLWVAFTYIVFSDLDYPVGAFLLPEDAVKYVENNKGLGFRIVDIHNERF